MKTIIHSLQAYMQHAHHTQAKESLANFPPSTARGGWPELPELPSQRRRSTDAMRWYPHGPQDDWKR